MFLLIFCTKIDSLKPGAPLKGVGAPFYIRLRDFLQNYLATLRSAEATKVKTWKLEVDLTVKIVSLNHN